MSEFLRITVTLSTPMVEPNNLLHLDGLLAALRVRQAEAATDEPVDPLEVQHDIPLERYTSPSMEWVFKASAFRLHRETETRMWMQSGRMDLVRVAEDRQSGLLKLRAAKPNLAGGYFKSSAYHNPILWAGLEAYCVGDKQAIESLLKDCDQVGGRRGVGSGKVQSIEVCTISEEECNWMYRALPVDTDLAVQGEYATSMKGLRPPYWDRTQHLPVLTPLDF
ncbi:hypothetical protein [Pseudomonas sp. MWU12-2323]|uniref:hypothetical protein n=1 Tax=Pseudomonas sp. MWU12-2323 TaxID=2651296 RepID=UPI00128C6428|nr:hypothetical protein [Pseudomonas sp. MWU12-2323]MPQ69349.1 hypothetical protein [Pseudomonas sp. MWU12-2323]